LVVIISSLSVIGGMSLLALRGPTRTNDYSAYVMGYFTESTEGAGNNYALHLAVSDDSLHWTPLNQDLPVATPTEGTRGLRDPFFLRKKDGTFVVLATDLNGQNWKENNGYIHVWDSTDLRGFTNYRRIRLHSMATHSWAPEAFYDAARGQYGIIYSANNGTHDVIMVNYTTDFSEVSPAQSYFDPGFDVLDATVVANDGQNYLYFKRNSDSVLLGARSTSLAPGSFDHAVYSGPIGDNLEGPIVVRALTGHSWYLWGDTYSRRYPVWQTDDLGGGRWSAMGGAAYNQPLNSRHATITPITAPEYTALLDKWGAPHWIRVRPANFPDRYLRHSHFTAKVDVYPFDPYADSQWRPVPGLADPAAVSFRSVNYPDRYLRHNDHDLVLDVGDGTAAFAQDATFYRTPGLADPNRTSFRSFNRPDLYLRHVNFAVRLDPIATALDKQDATFLVEY
jgi:hypothetical protein